MNDDVKHKWLMLDKDVAAVLMSMDQNYWKTYLRRDGKILVKLDKIMYGYMPANQFNVDLCLDTIAVLNRTRRDGQNYTPYEQFSKDHIDYERDFRCRWGG